MEHQTDSFASLCAYYNDALTKLRVYIERIKDNYKKGETGYFANLNIFVIENDIDELIIFVNHFQNEHIFTIVVKYIETANEGEYTNEIEIISNKYPVKIPKGFDTLTVADATLNVADAALLARNIDYSTCWLSQIEDKY